jgi:hypothetical protein
MSTKKYPPYTHAWGDGRFYTKLHAAAKADDACQEHINEVMKDE